MVLGILYFITLIIISSKILNIFKNIFAYLGMVFFKKIHFMTIIKYMV
jgi:hypothetical protein